LAGIIEGRGVSVNSYRTIFMPGIFSFFSFYSQGILYSLTRLDVGYIVILLLFILNSDLQRIGFSKVGGVKIFIFLRYTG